MDAARKLGRALVVAGMEPETAEEFNDLRADLLNEIGNGMSEQRDADREKA